MRSAASGCLMSLTLITAPAVEPITVAEARQQVLSTGVPDDRPELERLIQAVRERAELATGRAMITQTWDWVLDGFPSEGYVHPPLAPLQSVTHLKYTDPAGVLQTWATSNYAVNAYAGPRARRGRLSLRSGLIWPQTIDEAGTVQIRFVAGYGDDADAVPAILRQAMLLDLAGLYAQRENVITGTIVATLPGGSRDIYWAYRAHATGRAA